MPFPIFDLLEIDQLGLAKVVLSGTADQATLHVWCWRHGILICLTEAKQGTPSYLCGMFSAALPDLPSVTNMRAFLCVCIGGNWCVVVSHTHTHAHAGAHNFAACNLSFSCFFLTG